jgi:hypothetical protein
MKRQSKEEKIQYYVVLNQDFEVYIGLKGGKPQYSNKWNEYKPLAKNNTTILKFLNPKISLIKEEEFI